MPTFSERLKKAMAKEGITQEALALMVGVSQQAINSLISGANGSRKTAQIAKVLNVDPYWLATGEQPPSDSERASMQEEEEFYVMIDENPKPDPQQLIAPELLALTCSALQGAILASPLTTLNSPHHYARMTADVAHAAYKRLKELAKDNA